MNRIIKIVPSFCVKYLRPSTLKINKCYPYAGFHSSINIKTRKDYIIKSTPTVRWFSLPNSHKITPISSNKFKKIDGVPDDYDLMYRSDIGWYLLGSQLACTLTPLISTIAIAYSIYCSGGVLDFSQNEGFFSITSKNEFLIYMGSLYSTCFLVLYVVLSTPLRIYEKDGHYISVGHGPLGLQYPSKIMFKSGNCRFNPNPKFFLFRESQYDIHGKKVFLMEEFFRTSYDYNKMLYGER